MKIIYISIDPYKTEQVKNNNYELENIQFKRFSDVREPSAPINFLSKYMFPVNYQGCSDSHHKAWKHIIDNSLDDDEFYLILEEDANFSKQKIKIIETWLQDNKDDHIKSGKNIFWSHGIDNTNTFKELIVNDFSLLLYNFCFQPWVFKLDQKNVQDDRQSMQCFHTFFTQCYILNRKGAITLHDNLKRISYHVDAEISFLNAQDIIRIHSLPKSIGNIIKQDFDCSDKNHSKRHILHFLIDKNIDSRIRNILKFGLTMPQVRIGSTELNVMFVLSLCTFMIIFQSIQMLQDVISFNLSLNATRIIFCIMVVVYIYLKASYGLYVDRHYYLLITLITIANKQVLLNGILVYSLNTVLLQYNTLLYNFSNILERAHKDNIFTRIVFYVVILLISNMVLCKLTPYTCLFLSVLIFSLQYYQIYTNYKNNELIIEQSIETKALDAIHL